MADDDFYILSLSATRGDLIVWWMPKNSGYTCRLEDAGRYTRERVESVPGYYNDGENTLAIPCSEVEALAIKVVSASSENLATLTNKRFRMKTDYDGIDVRECSSCGQHPHETKLGLEVAGEHETAAKASA